MQSDLKALEFDGIRRILERLTFSPYGADAARNLEPAPNLDIAREMQRAVSAAREATDAYKLPRFNQVPDIRPALRQAGTTWCRAARQWIAQLAPSDADRPDVARAGGRLPCLIHAYQ